MNRIELLLQNKIKQKVGGEDGLVVRAEKTVTGGIWDELEESSIHNLLGIISYCEAVEEVQNFIKYQIGRSKANEKWRKANFGESLIKSLDKLADDAKIIAEELKITDENKIAQIWMKLTRLFLGYLYRYFKYKKG